MWPRSARVAQVCPCGPGGPVQPRQDRRPMSARVAPVGPCAPRWARVRPGGPVCALVGPCSRGRIGGPGLPVCALVGPCAPWWARVRPGGPVWPRSARVAPVGPCGPGLPVWPRWARVRPGGPVQPRQDRRRAKSAQGQLMRRTRSANLGLKPAQIWPILALLEPRRGDMRPAASAEARTPGGHASTRRMKFAARHEAD